MQAEAGCAFCGAVLPLTEMLKVPGAGAVRLSCPDCAPEAKADSS